MDKNGGLNISDLAGLSEPLTKLIETVSCGIGKVYEPLHIRRMAKAKAKELELISGVISDTLHLPVKYENGSIVIDTSDANELVERAQNRFLFQEMKKQQNIESVIDNAYSELKNVELVNNTPVDSDWISAFFDSVANISTEQMQKLWGKLLAGEVKCPGSFSLRTLSALKNLTQNEALAFKKISYYVLKCPGDYSKTFDDLFILSDKDLDGYGIPFSAILPLNEAGLLLVNSTVSVGFTLKPGEIEFFKKGNYAVCFKNISNDTIDITCSAFLLTEVGKELFPIISETMPDAETIEYLKHCKNVIAEYNHVSQTYHFDDIMKKIQLDIVQL